MLILSLLVLYATSSQAQLLGAQTQSKQPLPHRVLSEKVNENTVTIVSGNPNGTLLYLAYDLSAVLDKKDELRILPVVGKGAYQNVVDVLHLKGVDLGITQSNIIAHMRNTGEVGAGVERRIAYIAQLYTAEMHILAGAGIDKIEDLNGKPVNFSDAGSGTQFATRQIFGLLGIKPKEVNMGQSDAYLKMRTGEVAATIITAGKPVGAFSKFKLEPGMKLLEVPYREALEKDFFPGQISSTDYPNLLKSGSSVDTVSFSIVLISYNWPRNTERYRRVAKFVNAFFDHFDQFRKPPRHKTWRSTNLAAPVQGLQRFPAAEDWLKQSLAKSGASTGSGIDPVLARAQAARAAPNDPERQERLFRRFLEWSKKYGGN